MSSDIRSNPYEVHIGFPATEGRLLRELVQHDSRWAVLALERTWKRQGVGRFAAHDVPVGLRHLATATCPTFSTATEMMYGARDRIGVCDTIRVEIEKVLGAASDCDSMETLVQLRADGRRAAFVNDLPSYESHISIKRADGLSVESFELDSFFDRRSCRFDELAMIEGCTKAIFTLFFADAHEMFETTSILAGEIRGLHLANAVVKASMEQVLLCAKFV